MAPPPANRGAPPAKLGDCPNGIFSKENVPGGLSPCFALPNGQKLSPCFALPKGQKLSPCFALPNGQKTPIAQRAKPSPNEIHPPPVVAGPHRKMHPPDAPTLCLD